MVLNLIPSYSKYGNCILISLVPMRAAAPILKGFSKKGKKAAAPILKGYFKMQKSGRTYLKGVFQKRKKAAALILMGFQKSGRPYTLSTGRAGPGPTHFSWPLTLALRAGPLSAGPCPGSA